VCDCAELGQNIVKVEERCTKLGADNAELEAAVDRLRTALSQMEQMKKDLQHKVFTTTVHSMGRIAAEKCQKCHGLLQWLSFTEIRSHTYVQQLFFSCVWICELFHDFSLPCVLELCF